MKIRNILNTYIFRKSISLFKTEMEVHETVLCHHIVINLV